MVCAAITTKPVWRNPANVPKLLPHTVIEPPVSTCAGDTDVIDGAEK